MSNEPAKAEGGAKKKRNRKKKSKNNNNNGNNNAKEAAPKKEEPKQTNGSMNPHAAMRNSINAEGYSFEEIDKAMEEMWDKGLAYDEEEAVLKYLKTGGDGPADDDEKKKEDETKSVDEAKPEDGDTETSQESEQPEAPTAAEPKAKQAPMSMVAKLDMVADFENLSDAVFALTEWVNKAAKPKDIEELCGAQNTSALPKIIRRSITESDDNIKFETIVLPAMDRLVAALLGKCGVAPTSFAESRMCFEALMKQARRVFLLQQPDSEDYANRVSEFIVSRMSIALEECKMITTTVTSNGSTVTGNGVKSSAISSVDDAIAHLLATRELHKTAAKRFSSQAGSAVAALTTVNGGSTSATTNGHARESDNSLDKADIFLAIGGPGVKETYDKEKTRLEDLKGKVAEIDTAKAKEMQHKLEEVQSERQLIAQRIAELKISIENLEAHDAELCSQVVQLEADVEAERSTKNAVANKLNDEVKESQKAVKYGNSIGTLVDMLKNYDDALDAAVNGSVQSSVEDTENKAEVASKSMALFSSRVAKYFAAEAQCVDFLKKRIEENVVQIPALKIEIAECEGLGMATTLDQMDKSLKEKEGQLETDPALIDRLTKEASTMFDTLINRLEQYATVADGGVDYDALQGIPANATILGINKLERLTTILEANGGFSIRSTDPTVAAPNGGKKVAPIGTPKAMTEQSKTIPKFTWAAASKPEAAQKASLVDIQKEELESRSGA